MNEEKCASSGGSVGLQGHGSTGLLGKAGQGSRDLPEAWGKAPEDRHAAVFAMGAMSSVGAGRGHYEGARKRNTVCGNDADTKDPRDL